MTERIDLSEADIKQVEKLARYLTVEQTGHYLGFSTATFERIRKRDRRVDDAWQRGRARRVAKHAQLLERWARSSKNPKAAVTALIFWLKAAGGWREADKTPAQASVGSVNVIINAPVPPGLVKETTVEVENRSHVEVEGRDVIGCFSPATEGEQKEAAQPALPARQRWDMADREPDTEQDRNGVSGEEAES
jgi:hypothetical protein